MVKKERKMGRNKKVPLNKNFDTLKTYDARFSRIEKKFDVEMKKFLFQSSQNLSFLNKMMKLEVELEI